MKFDRFDKILSFEPEKIRDMTPNQKRDVMDAINNRKKTAFCYSALFLLGVIVYFIVRNYYNFMFALRDVKLLTSASPLVIVFALGIVILSSFACMMSRGAMVLTILSFALTGTFMLFRIESAVSPEPLVLAACVFGMVVYYWLMGVYDAHEALKNEKGYPYFTELSKDMLNAPEPENQDSRNTPKS